VYLGFERTCSLSLEFRIQLFMEPPVAPPEKRTSFASPAMLYVIVGIIAGSFVLFLVFRP
jgi:hypothetical protein